MRQFEFSTGQSAAPTESFTVSGSDPIDVNARPIFSADYARDGHDLVISTPGQADLRLVDYFLQDTPPDLVADNGAVLRGDLAARLAGPIAPGQYAQVGNVPSTDPIGQVETLEGPAYAERADGTRVELEVGSKIYENDVLVTQDGKLAVTFADGTIFTLAANSRMVIDSLVYDADSEDGNSGAFSLVEGGFVFIAGEVARTGGMDVSTPTATMGIRGTTVLVEITTVDGVSTVEVSLNVDPDGHVGAFELRDLDGNLIATIDSTDTKWIVSPVEGETREVIRTADDLADDQTLLLDAARAYALAFQRVDAGGTFVELVSTPSSNNDGPDLGDGTGTEGNDSNPDDNQPSGSTTGGTGGTGTTSGGSGGGSRQLNNAPQAQDDAKSGSEDGPVTGNVLSNDSDADADALTVIINSRPKHGTLEIDQDGNYSYTPDANYNGTDSFSYTISDGNGGTDSGTVTFTVTSVQDPPEAVNDTVTLTEDAGTVALNVLSNDSDPDGDTLTVIDWSGLDEEYASGGADGSFSFTPPADFNGTEIVTYTVSDGHGHTDIATLTITVTPQADAPVANDVSDAVDEDGSLSVWPDFDPVDADGDPVTLIAFSQGAHGSVVSDGEGGFIYTPDENFNGSDTFTYTVSDGNDLTDIATVTVTVNAVNDDPVAVAESAGTDEDTSIAIPATFETTDVDGDTVAILSLNTDETSGSASINEDGDGFNYDPNGAFEALGVGETALDSFSYTVTDGHDGTDTASVTVTITGANDGPVAAADTGATGEDGGSILIDVLANDSDADTSDTLSVLSLDDTETAGSVSVDVETGGVLYDPNGAFEALGVGETALDSFSYTLTDGHGGTDTASVTVTITGANDGPVAADTSADSDDGGAATGTVTATDVDGDSLTFALASSPEHGSVNVGSDGSYTYTPDEGFSGFDTFEVGVTDGNGGSDTATVTVEVSNETYTSSSGQAVSLKIAEDPVGAAPAGNLRVGVSEVQSTTINLSFALDTSGSVGTSGWQSIEDAVYSALNQLATQFSGSQTTVNVQVVQYGSSITYNGSFDLTQETASLLTAVQSLTHQGGSTYWNLAIDAAKGFFDSHGVNDTNILYFITDGVPTGSSWETSLANLNAAPYDVDIQAFGIGAGFGTSQLIALDSDDTPIAVSTPGALLDAIQESPLFAAQLVDLSVSLVADGFDHGMIADETSPALTADGLNFDLPLAEIAGIGDLLGEDNLFTATATFDLDGDLLTMDDRVTINSNEQIAKHATAQTTTGTDGSDLLLGSDLADDISGGDGNDVILGFDGDDRLAGGIGNDTLIGGAGNDVLIDDLGADIFDGGAGRDLLELATGAASDLIQTLAGSDIEAIDLSNGVNDTLTFSEADVMALSGTADTDLETLLGEAMGNSATILGETGDTITLAADAAGAWQETTTGVSDGHGNTLDIYQFVDTHGSVLATLGVDDDVQVNYAVATA